MQNMSSICPSAKGNFWLIPSFPKCAVIKSTLAIVISGALSTRECFFSSLVVLLQSCWISSFLVYLMNFQLSHSYITQWRTRRIFFLIAGEVNNSAQCWACCLVLCFTDTCSFICLVERNFWISCLNILLILGVGTISLSSLSITVRFLDFCFWKNAK